MRQFGAGRIVNLSSMGGKLVLPGDGFYHASEYALEPGLIRTGFAEAPLREMKTSETATVSDSFHHAVAIPTRELLAAALIGSGWRGFAG